jgi:hypothetical protein
VAERARTVLRLLEGDLGALAQGRAPERPIPSHLLVAYERLGKPLQRHLQLVKVDGPSRRFEIGRSVGSVIQKIMAEGTTAVGSVTGFLDAVNVHGAPRFYLYPVLSRQKVDCRFPKEMISEVGKALTRYVAVSGVLSYGRHDAFPRRVEAEDLHVMPPADELPSLKSLRGTAPGVTGDLDSVAFVREARDADET